MVAAVSVVQVPLTVVMPVRNALPYLSGAIESILGQTFSDFLFLIIDDGSTDGSSELIRSYASKDARIKLASGPQQGVAAVRQFGLMSVETPLLAWMDADDISAPDRLEKQVLWLKGHPEVAVLGADMVVIDAEGRPLAHAKQPSSYEEIAVGMRQGCVINNPTVMMRCESAKRAGGYRSFFKGAEDFDLWLRLLDGGEILANIPVPLVYYRKHSANMTCGDAKLLALYSALAQESSHCRRRGLFDFLPNATELSSPESFEVFFSESKMVLYSFYRTYARYLISWTSLWDRNSIQYITSVLDKIKRIETKALKRSYLLSAGQDYFQLRLVFAAYKCIQAKNWIHSLCFFVSALRFPFELLAVSFSWGINIVKKEVIKR